ncbi:MAG: thiamine pyrophosphate-binding protein [Candidatus Rokubacteria bacterium]|nr:thiamine pyrophosphate-binding protein [Candidatus Rokubacteria bacterium]
MAQITVALALAKLLERMGTEYVFGVNGHGNWALLDALVHDTRIKGIPARAEDHALQMADGYWRVRRQAPMPIVTTSVGPGNANIVSALAGAFYESIAMLVFAGAGATHWFDRGGIEEAYRYAPEEWTQIVKPISKKAVLITRPDTAVDMFLRAYRTAITGRPVKEAPDGDVAVLMIARDLLVRQVPPPRDRRHRHEQSLRGSLWSFPGRPSGQPRSRDAAMLPERAQQCQRLDRSSVTGALLDRETSRSP